MLKVYYSVWPSPTVGPCRFDNHEFKTSNPEEQRIIEGSEFFKGNYIQLSGAGPLPADAPKAAAPSTKTVATPNVDELEAMAMGDLRRLAKARGVKSVASWKKSDFVAAIKAAKG